MRIISNRKGKLSTGSYLLIIFVAAILLFGGGLAWISNLVNQNMPTIPTIPTTPTVPGQPAPPGVIHTAAAQWNIRDALTETATDAGDTGYVCITRANNGLFNFLSSVEETEFNAAPDTSSGVYSSGDELIIAVSSDNDPTGGDETYPRWFYIQSLDHSAVIYGFPLANPISALSGSVGAYSVNVNVLEDTGEKVTWVEGTTPYWRFGNFFEVYGRVDNAGMIQQITNKGVVGTTLNDGNTWEDTDAEINANFTMTSDQEDLYFELIGEAADVAYGLPILGVSATGEVTQYSAVLIFATDALALSTSYLYDDGWRAINKPDMTADLAFYYVIDPVRDGGIPNRGEIIDISISITINDSGLTASNEYEFEGWVLDGQRVDYVASGVTSTTVPPSNGFLTEQGIDAIVEPRALTISSGSVATPQLMGHYTTNA